MGALLREKTWTVTDIEALPEDTRAELIDGEIYYLAAPSRTHQILVRELLTAINSYIKSGKGRCEVYAAPFAVYLFGTEDPYHYLEPDICVICDPDKLVEKGCNGAPDWIIEVVSPSTASMDYLTKLWKYQTAGVREYWIVDPQAEKAIIYTFLPQKTYAVHAFTDAIPVSIYPDLTIKISDFL